MRLWYVIALGLLCQTAYAAQQEFEYAIGDSQFKVLRGVSSANVHVILDGKKDVIDSLEVFKTNAQADAELALRQEGITITADGMAGVPNIILGTVVTEDPNGGFHYNTTMWFSDIAARVGDTDSVLYVSTWEAPIGWGYCRDHDTDPIRKSLRKAMDAFCADLRKARQLPLRSARLEVFGRKAVENELAGVTGVVDRITIKDFSGSHRMDFDLDAMRAQLRDCGLKTYQVGDETKGKPKVGIFSIGLAVAKAGSPLYTHYCTAKYEEPVQLVRDRNIIALGCLWRDTSVSGWVTDGRVESVVDNARDAVKHFMNAYLRANPKKPY